MFLFKNEALLHLPSGRTEDLTNYESEQHNELPEILTCAAALFTRHKPAHGRLETGAPGWITWFHADSASAECWLVLSLRSPLLGLNLGTYWVSFRDWMEMELQQNNERSSEQITKLYFTRWVVTLMDERPLPQYVNSDGVQFRWSGPKHALWTILSIWVIISGCCCWISNPVHLYSVWRKARVFFDFGVNG